MLKVSLLLTFKRTILSKNLVKMSKRMLSLRSLKMKPKKLNNLYRLMKTLMTMRMKTQMMNQTTSQMQNLMRNQMLQRTRRMTRKMMRSKKFNLLKVKKKMKPKTEMQPATLPSRFGR